MKKKFIACISLFTYLMFLWWAVFGPLTTNEMLFSILTIYIFMPVACLFNTFSWIKNNTYTGLAAYVICVVFGIFLNYMAFGNFSKEGLLVTVIAGVIGLAAGKYSKLARPD